MSPCLNHKTEPLEKFLNGSAMEDFIVFINIVIIQTGVCMNGYGDERNICIVYCMIVKCWEAASAAHCFFNLTLLTLFTMQLRLWKKAHEMRPLQLLITID